MKLCRKLRRRLAQICKVLSENEVAFDLIESDIRVTILIERIDEETRLMRVDHNQIGTRAGTFLNNASITTIGELVQKTGRELRKLPGCGSTTVEEIRDYLRESGLALADDLSLTVKLPFEERC